MVSGKLLMWLLQGGFLILCSCITDRDKIPGKSLIKQAPAMHDLSREPEETPISTWPLDSLIKLLLHDNYELAYDTLWYATARFISHKISTHTGDTLQFRTKRIITVRAKRKINIRNARFHPSLAIQQIVFEPSADMENIEKRIEKVIYDSKDVIHEKLYDKVRLCDGVLYYLVTPAKIFENEVIKCDKALEKINARL